MAQQKRALKAIQYSPMQVFTAAPHHDVLLLLIQIALLLFTARLFGELAQRFGQPSVLGEILAGIVLGPSVLSGLIPEFGQIVVPQTPLQGHLLEVVSMIGAMLLLLITGLETDLALIRRHARTAIGVSLGGVIFTFVTGFLLGQQIPAALLGQPDQRLIFSLFIATAMSISAIPVIAKVLMDMNLMRRDIGQIIIAAGMSDDTIGWILLSIVAGLASGQGVSAGSVFEIVASILGFLIFSLTIGRYLVKRLLDWVQDEAISHERLLSLVIVLTFAWGAITQSLKLEAVLGAFVMGIILSQMPRLPQSVIHRLESIALGVFSPIFFAVAGLKVNVHSLLTFKLLVVTALVIAVATLGKVIGTYLGARFIGRRDPWTSLSFGAGLNARGAMEIIIATIGLSLGILTQDMFSIIVVMAMTTSLMAPLALRFVLKRVQPEEHEIQRLRREELSAKSFTANLKRVLLPVRLHRGQETSLQIIEAKILSGMSQRSPLSLTLMTISSESQRMEANSFLQEISSRFTANEVLKKVVVSNDVGTAILDESAKDYDLVVMGARSDTAHESAVFNPVIDSMIRLTTCSSMVIKGGSAGKEWTPRKILIPTDGSVASKNAADLAFALAPDGGQVTLLHVITQAGYFYQPSFEDDRMRLRLQMGQQFLDDLKQMGEMRPISINTSIELGHAPEQVILEVARKQQIDLIIIGTDIRLGSERLFLGPKVEYLLKHANCPLVVINAAVS